MGRLRTTAAASVIFLAALPLSAAHDDFYLNLLHRGMAHVDAGQYDTAVRELHIAAFGLVDSIPQFEIAHIYLALAADHLKIEADARRSAQRVIAAERIDRRYGSLSIPATTRRSFEDIASRLLTNDQYAFLRSSPANVGATSPQPQIVQPMPQGGYATASGGPATASGGPSTASGGPSTASGGPSTASGGGSTASGGGSTASGGGSTASGGGSTASEAVPQPQRAQPQPVVAPPTRPPVTQPPARAPREETFVVPMPQPQPPPRVMTKPVPTPVPAPRTVAPQPKPQRPAPQPAMAAPQPSTPRTHVNADAQLTLADSAIEHDNLPEAVRIFKVVLEDPNLTHAQLLRVGEGAYRARDFVDSARALERSGFRGGEEPYRYYYAVALFETGDYAAAKRELAAALPHIELTREVARYRTKIQGSAP